MSNSSSCSRSMRFSEISSASMLLTGMSDRFLLWKPNMIVCGCVVCVVLCVVQSVFPVASRLFFDRVDDIESVMLRMSEPTTCVRSRKE